MARDNAGTFTLHGSQPVSSGTTISSSDHNSTMSDIETALTDSLDRNGRGGMAAALVLNNTGTKTAPDLTFSGDLDTGLYRAGANNPAISAGDTKVQEWTTTGTAVTGTLSASGAATLSSTLAVTGNATVGGTLGVTGASTLTGAVSAAAGLTVTQSAANTAGATITGNGTGPGITVTSGASGSGLTVTVDGATANTNDRFALTAAAGHIRMDGDNPTSTTSFSNTLTPSNIPKAWGVIDTNGSGSATVTAGFNIASASVSATQITVNIAGDLESANYVVLGSIDAVGGGLGAPTAWPPTFSSHAAGSFRINIFTSADAVVNPSTTAVTVRFVVFGRQDT